MKIHTALTENPTKKPTIFTSIQTTLHQSLKKFNDQLKKDSLNFFIIKKYFSGVSRLL